jgi:hypothetical protein
MHSRILAFAICAAGVSACALPKGMNDECGWPSEQAFVLDLQDAAHRRHLLNDVRVAEELGVRFHDTYLNRGRGRPDWPLTRDDCDATLFESIGRNHDVTMADIRQARTQLSQQWDPFTYVPLAALYFFGAFGLSRWIRRRFANDEWVPTMVAALFASMVLAGCVLALGHLWGGAVEMVRLGNMHMTYRADRLGWHGHASSLFIAGTLVFFAGMLIGTVVRARRARPDSPTRTNYS